MSAVEIDLALFLIFTGLGILAYVIACQFSDARHDKPNVEDRNDITHAISTRGYRP